MCRNFETASATTTVSGQTLERTIEVDADERRPSTKPPMASAPATPGTLFICGRMIQSWTVRR